MRTNFSTIALAVCLLACVFSVHAQCAPGQEDDGTGVCRSCLVGTFNPSTGGTCQDCPVGTYGLVSAAISEVIGCGDCPAGTFSTSTGLTAESQCTPCPAGQYSGATRATTCDLCPVGTESAATGRTTVATCTACVVGTASNEQGQDACPACPAGSYASTTGQTTCDPCPEGLLCSGGSTSTCAAGQQTTDGINCVACAVGELCTGSILAVPCPAGMGATGPGQCTECSAGTSAAGGAATCEPCAPGTIAQLGRADACDACPAGQYSVTTTMCTNCTAGTYSDGAGAGECTLCPPGTVSLALGASDVSSCEACPRGTTSPARANSTAGPMFCVECPAGTFQNLTGAAAGQCLECPDNSQCTETGQGAPIADAGFWLAPGDYQIVHRCAVPQFCPGGEPGVCSDERTGFLCNDCDVDSFKLGIDCVTCPDDVPWPLIIVAVVAIVVVVALVVFGDLQTHAPSLSILLRFMQLLALLTDMSFSFPESVNQFFGWLRISYLSPDVAQAECYDSLDFLGEYKTKMQIILVSPIVLAVIFIAVAALFRLLESRFEKGTRWYRNADKGIRVLFRNYMRILSVTYVLLAITILQGIDCTQQPNGDYTLDVSPSTLCWEGDHWEAVVYSILGIALYIIGIPALYMYVLYRGHKGGSLRRRRYLLSFEVRKYKNRDYYWEIVILAEGLGLVLVQTLLTTRETAQAVLAILVVLAAGVAAAVVRPFKRVRHHIISLILHAGSLLVLIIALVRVETVDESEVADREDTFTSVAIAIVVIGSLIAWGIIFVLDLQWAFKSHRAAKDARRAVEGAGIKWIPDTEDFSDDETPEGRADLMVERSLHMRSLVEKQREGQVESKFAGEHDKRYWRRFICSPGTVHSHYAESLSHGLSRADIDELSAKIRANIAEHGIDTSKEIDVEKHAPDSVELKKADNVKSAAPGANADDSSEPSSEASEDASDASSSDDEASSSSEDDSTDSSASGSSDAAAGGDASDASDASDLSESSSE